MVTWNWTWKTKAAGQGPFLIRVVKGFSAGVTISCTVVTSHCTVWKVNSLYLSLLEIRAPVPPAYQGHSSDFHTSPTDHCAFVFKSELISICRWSCICWLSISSLDWSSQRQGSALNTHSWVPGTEFGRLNTHWRASKEREQMADKNKAKVSVGSF